MLNAERLLYSACRQAVLVHALGRRTLARHAPPLPVAVPRRWGKKQKAQKPICQRRQPHCSCKASEHKDSVGAPYGAGATQGACPLPNVARNSVQGSQYGAHSSGLGSSCRVNPVFCQMSFLQPSGPSAHKVSTVLPTPLDCWFGIPAYGSEYPGGEKGAKSGGC